MERIEVLIHKLKEQFEQKASPGSMLVTVQLLEAELSRLQSGSQQTLGTSKVAVMMPRTSGSVQRPFFNPDKKEEKIVYQLDETEMEDEVAEEEIKNVEPVIVKKPIPPPVKPKDTGFLFDPMTEIPTLSQQSSPKEVHETLSVSRESLNDKLKQPNTELGDTLKHEPVRDLRKAIGINDRFVFINELFRGDEAMYERSIKTINSFHIYAEAEYWMNRELKIKLGWDEDQETVRHFYLLVKRRFS
jgi:hypothetical protein